ncbi:outer membrane lipoprotein-sorting protein [candidate division KSB1 bacterium]|nr:MAG: outer membrane lipoprotein-sorting protein [candidate division KSB1 bacterium]
MKMYSFTVAVAALFLLNQQQDAQNIIKKVEKNRYSDNKYVVSTMIIHGRRAVRKIKAKSWIKGEEKSFTEYISPARERGTKMLKIKDNLWMYSPSSDRIIRISGNMLRQSLMGSDLTYEDMMEDPVISSHYSSVILGDTIITNRKCWKIKLKARTEDVSYKKRIILVDKERFVILQDERYAKSGTLLRKVSVKKMEFIQGKWIATHIIFKDMLKRGKGTEFIINEIKYNVKIPSYRFSKSSLKR